jgi:gamma-glutamyltranspeptidase/glutathione hydrolase
MALHGASAPVALHRYLEASKLAYADRNRFIGDPAFVNVPLDELLSKGFAGERRCLIGMTALPTPVPRATRLRRSPASSRGPPPAPSSRDPG